MRTRLRQMRPGDVPVIREKLREQNERDGTSYGMPVVFDAQGQRVARVPLALVSADVKTGEPVQGHVWEVTLEQTSFGISSRATVCSMQEQEAIMFLLRERGFRDMHLLVPKERVADMQHGLERIYKMSRTGMTHFYRMLDPAENEAVRDFYRGAA